MLLFFSVAFSPQFEEECGGDEFVVVELFTSQGCHSCPPADKLLSKLVDEAEAKGQKIYPLSFHVDYWNYLGWKDPYSDAAFSERQRKYSVALKSGVYTPQMVFNGTQEAIGSKSEEVRHRLKRAKRAAFAEITLQTNLNQKTTVLDVSYDIRNAPQGSVLNIALVERDLTDAVSRGENRGKKLHHDNVVRQFISTKVGEGKQRFEVTDVNLAKASIIAFVQSERTMEIFAAKKISLK